MWPHAGPHAPTIIISIQAAPGKPGASTARIARISVLKLISFESTVRCCFAGGSNSCALSVAVCGCRCAAVP